MSTHNADNFRQRRRAQGVPPRDPLSTPRFRQRATELQRLEQLPWPTNLFDTDQLSRTQQRPPLGSATTVHDGSPARPSGNNQPGSREFAIQLLNHAAGALNIDRIAAAELIDRALALLSREDGRTGVEDVAVEEGRTRGGLAPWQVCKVAGYVDAMLAFTITVSDCARLTGLSVSSFSRNFKASFGQTLIGYIIRRRTERAKELMILTDEPLCHIALTCGFADQPHLSRWFGRLEGVSPTFSTGPSEW